MTAKTPARFDIADLRAVAGETVFARGAAYHRDGQVEILAIEPARVLTQVAGSEDYCTVVIGRGKEIGGECSCPFFADRGFCKHMVAAALAANAARADTEAEGAGALARIREHLRSKGIDALVEMIVGLAERDAALFRRLELAAAATQADDKTLAARLRKAIDRATRTRGFVDYREVLGWAADVAAVLDSIADLIPAGHPGIAVGLAERAIARIERAIEEIDDSDGHCGGLLQRASEIHLAAVREARPDPVTLANDLFGREMESEYDTFAGAAALYADVLGSDGLDQYRRLAGEAWAELPSRSAGACEQGEFGVGYDRLMSILDFFAERDGNTDARIALRAKDLSSPWRYLQLAEFCRDQGRHAEALRRAEEGLWVFEDGRPDERLVLIAADLLATAGRKDDAEAQLWRAFRKAPRLGLYERLRKVGGRPAHQCTVDFLESHLGKEKPTRWGFPADLLIHVLMQEKRFDVAWTAVSKHGASMGLKETLARASQRSHPEEALAVYAERVDQLANAGGNPAYAEAAALIARMGALRGVAEQAAFLVAFKTRFRLKRNLMKLLDDGAAGPQRIAKE